MAAITSPRRPPARPRSAALEVREEHRAANPPAGAEQRRGLRLRFEHRQEELAEEERASSGGARRRELEQRIAAVDRPPRPPLGAGHEREAAKLPAARLLRGQVLGEARLEGRRDGSPSSSIHVSIHIASEGEERVVAHGLLRPGGSRIAGQT